MNVYVPEIGSWTAMGRQCITWTRRSVMPPNTVSWPSPPRTTQRCTARLQTSPSGTMAATWSRLPMSRSWRPGLCWAPWWGKATLVLGAFSFCFFSSSLLPNECGVRWEAYAATPFILVLLLIMTLLSLHFLLYYSFLFSLFVLLLFFSSSSFIMLLLFLLCIVHLNFSSSFYVSSLPVINC